MKSLSSYSLIWICSVFCFSTGFSDIPRVLTRFFDARIEKYYQSLYKEVVPARPGDFPHEAEFIERGIRHRSKICSTIVNSLFFGNRLVKNFEMDNPQHIQELEKYYKRISKFHLKELNKTHFWKIKDKKKIADIFPNKYVDLQVGKNKFVERVFPCIIKNQRSNVIEEVWISRSYRQIHFILVRDRNLKLKIIAYAESPIIVSNKYPDGEPEDIVGNQDDFCNLHPTEKLSICNLAINTQWLAAKNEFNFSPQFFNLGPECVLMNLSQTCGDRSTALLNILAIRVIQCKSLDVIKNRNVRLYISSVFFWQPPFTRSVYVYKKENGTNYLTPIRFAADLRLNTKGEPETYASRQVLLGRKSGKL